MGEPWEEGGMRNDELEVGSGGSRRRGSEKGFLHGSHLLSPLVEAGPAECLGQELGSLSLQKLETKRAQGAVCLVQPGAHTRSPLWAVQAPGPSEPSSHHQESSWLKPRVSCPRRVSRCLSRSPSSDRHGSH